MREDAPMENLEIHPVQIEAYRKMSPAEKLNLAMELRDVAWALKRAHLRSLHPDWSDKKLEEATREIFRHAGD